jgi:hypothetical protein
MNLGYQLAKRDRQRMILHWEKVWNKPLGFSRHMIYCAWLGFLAPVLWTKTGRDYREYMKRR